MPVTSSEIHELADRAFRLLLPADRDRRKRERGREHDVYFLPKGNAAAGEQLHPNGSLRISDRRGRGSRLGETAVERSEQ